MTAISTSYFTAEDGVRLAVHEAGAGRPVVLLHGLFSNAHTNWVKYGAAETLVASGFKLIMPDLRAHGQSDASHDAAAYPEDILVADGLALIRHLGLSDGDYDLGGYSLGGRTVARMLIKGAQPRRAIISGMGVAGMLRTGSRSDFFRRVLSDMDGHERGSGAWMAAQFLKTTGGDPEANMFLLDSFVDSTEAELRTIAVPTLVLAGEQDDDNGSAQDLADLLQNGVYESMPGNHMSAVARPELGQKMAQFLLG